MVLKQSRYTLVCQKCGRTAVRGSEGTEHWLDEPSASAPSRINVVRCPAHWTDWALRNTREGRTNALRERMAEARLQPPGPDSDPFLDPYVR